MANKPAAKRAKGKKSETNPNRWMLVLLAAFFVIVMVIVPIAYVLNQGTPRTPVSTTTPTTSTFSSISDALMDLPLGAQYVRYVDLNSSAVMAWAHDNGSAYLGQNLPNATLFGAVPYKDAIASYPFSYLGYTDVDPQVVVLSDFGTGFDNKNLSMTSYGGVPMRQIASGYGFSTGTYPVVSGIEEFVAAVVSHMSSTTSSANTAYATYSGLISQANQSNAVFAVVGQTNSLSLGNTYYGGITQLNDTMFDSRVVVALNQSLNQSQMSDYLTVWQEMAPMYNLMPVGTQISTGNAYVTFEAQGTANDCLNDLAGLDWNFIKG